MAESLIKRLELAIRRRYNGWVTRGADPLIVDAPCATPIVAANARILLLRQDRIGDVLVSTPIIAELRARYPAATIGMVLSTNNKAVAYTVEPFVDRTHLYRKSLIDLFRLRRELRSCRYDVVIDLMDNPSSTSALLIQGSAAQLAVGVDKENRRVYTHVVPLADRTSVHIVERIARVTWPLGFGLALSDLRPRIPGAVPRRDAAHSSWTLATTYRLGVNISGSDVDRMYPEEQMIAALRSVANTYANEISNGTLTIAIMSAPHHHAIAMRIADAIGATCLDPMPSFRDFAQAIGSCDMFMTPDTSAVHVAAAWNVPSVVLFAQDDRKLLPWYPYNTKNWSCIAHNAPLAAIATEDVAAAVTAMIHETTGLSAHHS